MAALTAAIVAGSVLSAGAGIYSSKKAAKAQQQASDAATAEQRRQFDIAFQASAPYRQAGQRALTSINSLLGLTGGQGAQMRMLKQSPGYKFRLGQGLRAVENSAAARGGALSGNALRAITQFGQGYAADELDRQFNRLATVAGLGHSSANAVGNQAITTGNLIGQNMLAAGNARASGYYNAGQAVNNAVQGGIGNYLTYDLLRKNPYPTGNPYPYGG